jgi:hypothetical protein
MKGNYPPGPRKARSKRIGGKTRFTHNSRPKNQPAESDGDRMNTGGNAIPTANGFPHNSAGPMREKQNLGLKNQNADLGLDKRQRGRPGIARDERRQILGRADQFRYMLSETTRTPGRDKPESLWDKVRERVLKARTEGEITGIFEQERYGQSFVPHLSRQIFKTIRDPRFPKSPDAQANFLADSIAALERASPRHSRNICQQARSEQRSA